MKRFVFLSLLAALSACEIPARERVLLVVVKPYDPETGKVSAPEQWDVRAGELAIAQPGDTLSLHDIHGWGRTPCIVVKMESINGNR